MNIPRFTGKSNNLTLAERQAAEERKVTLVPNRADRRAQEKRDKRNARGLRRQNTRQDKQALEATRALRRAAKLFDEAQQ